MTHSDTVAGKVDLTGIINPTATLTVNGVAAARQGEYFHRAVDVSNGSAPVDQSISVTSNYGSTQTVTENIYVPKSAEVYTYDDGGNLLSDGRWNYTWDAENRLIEMDTIAGVPTSAEKRIEFEYDYKGRSIRKKVYEPNGGGETLVLERKYLFDGWNLQAELDGSDAVIRKYLWGPDLSGTTHGAGGVGGLLMICDIPSYGNKDYYFVGADGNGNVTVLVDADAGTVEGQYEYGPFGESLRVTGSAIAGENPFRFSSKYTDTESGFLYYGFRHYDPETGRWLSRDPIEEAGGLNLALTNSNDSLNRYDALGFSDNNRPPVIVFPPGSGKLPIYGNPRPVFGYVPPIQGPPTLADEIILGVIEIWVPVQAVLEFSKGNIYAAVGDIVLGKVRVVGRIGAFAKNCCSKIKLKIDFFKKPKITNGGEQIEICPPPNTRHDLHADLRDKAFDYKSTSGGGYVTYKGADGKKVTIKPSGEVIRTQKVLQLDGSGAKFPQRQDYNGNPLPGQPHDTGHFVEPIREIVPY